MITRSDAARAALGAAFILAGALHFVIPQQYAAIVPRYLPAPGMLVALSGAAEILGGLGLLLPRWRRAAGLGLLLLLASVLPANVEMLRQARAREVAAPFEAVLWLRLPFQAVLMWWVWRLSRPSAPRAC